MFDIGFLELVLLSIVALVVLGPDRLPGALRTAGLWIGRLRRSFNNIKADIEREVGADEIRRQLRNEAIMEKIKNTRSQVNEGLNSVKQQAEAVKKDLNLDKELKDLNDDIESTLPSPTPTPPPPPPIPPAQPGDAGEQAAAAGELTAVPPPAQPAPAQPAPDLRAPESAPSIQEERKKSGQK